MEDLLDKAKQCLSIVSTSSMKNDEIEMLINAGIEDLKRQGIKACVNTENSLVISAIMMFVKSNFGMVDIKEKELAQRTYSLLCNNLSLSSEYKERDSDA